MTFKWQSVQLWEFIRKIVYVWCEVRSNFYTPFITSKSTKEKKTTLDTNLHHLTPLHNSVQRESKCKQIYEWNVSIATNFVLINKHVSDKVSSSNRRAGSFCYLSRCFKVAKALQNVASNFEDNSARVTISCIMIYCFCNLNNVFCTCSHLFPNVLFTNNEPAWHAFILDCTVPKITIRTRKLLYSVFIQLQYTELSRNYFSVKISFLAFPVQVLFMPWIYHNWVYLIAVIRLVGRMCVFRCWLCSVLISLPPEDDSTKLFIALEWNLVVYSFSFRYALCSSNLSRMKL